MIANYHTHTWRCRHARGTEREYVEKAIERGVKILGFSDHSPYIFPETHFSGHRMALDQAEDYAQTILALKKEYQNEIEIHLGVEIEYYPLFWDRTLQLLRDLNVEYLLLGQHFLDNEIDAWHNGGEHQEEALLVRYVEQCREAMETGLITYFAHPDLPQYTGDPEVYDRCMRQLCRDAKRQNIPLEINFLGLNENRFYPNPEFWKIAGEEGCDVIFGADAHDVNAVCSPEDIRNAMKLVEKYGLKLIDTVELRRL